MSLEGSLASFGLPDVLSLLAMTNKTGRLRLRRADGEVRGTVVLKDGVVVAAAADDADNTLARRFIAAGLIDGAALERGLDESAAGELAEALVGAADLAPSAIEELAREQVLDAVFDLLGWGDGEFGFDVCDVSPARSHIEVAATVVVAEAQRRLTSLKELTDRLPDPYTVLALPLVAADERPVGADERPVGADERPVGADEWAAMALVDGRRTLAEALGLSDRGAWQTLTVFAGLLERGLLVEASDRRSVVYRASLMAMLDGSVEIGFAEVPAFAAPPAAEAAEVHAPSAVSSAPVSAFDTARSPEPVLVADAHAAVEVVAAAEPFAAAEPVYAAEPVADPQPADAQQPADEGIDDALLQQLMAGARAL